MAQPDSSEELQGLAGEYVLGTLDPGERAEAERLLASDPDFAGVRGEEALAKLPSAEAEQWRRIWKDVARLLERARSQ